MIDEEFKDLQWKWAKEEQEAYVKQLEYQLKLTQDKLLQVQAANEKLSKRPAGGQLQGSHKKVITSVRLPPDLYAWMIRQDISQALLIEKAMRIHYNIPKP